MQPELKRSWQTPDTVEMVEPTDHLGNRAIFEAHHYPKLQEVTIEKKQEIEKSLTQLEEVVNS